MQSVPCTVQYAIESTGIWYTVSYPTLRAVLASNVSIIELILNLFYLVREADYMCLDIPKLLVRLYHITYPAARGNSTTGYFFILLISK